MKKHFSDEQIIINECRPNSALNYLSPAEFGVRWQNGNLMVNKPTLLTDGCI